MKCEKCNKEHDGKYGSGRFCSSTCSHSYSSNKIVREDKSVICFVCKKNILVKKNSSKNKSLCCECRKKKKDKKRTCSICGNPPCKRRDVCRKKFLFSSLINYFGFDENVLGTEMVYDEFDRIKKIAEYEYVDLQLGSVEMSKLHNCKNPGSFANTLKSLGVELRTCSQAVSLSYANGNSSIKSCNFPYKNGWHTTWDDKKIFYRSSYELNFAKQLDDQNILYEVESLRIAYWDSQSNRKRTAIPDFYLPTTNEIVEIKSKWTLDKQNMIDKIKSYKKNGYQFKLIIDGVEFNKLTKFCKISSIFN